MSHQFQLQLINFSCNQTFSEKNLVQNTSFFPSTAPVQVVARLLHLICFVRSVRETASTKYLLALSNLPPLCQPGTLSLLRPSPIVASSTLKICSVGKFFDASACVQCTLYKTSVSRLQSFTFAPLSSFSPVVASAWLALADQLDRCGRGR